MPSPSGEVERKIIMDFFSVIQTLPLAELKEVFILKNSSAEILNFISRSQSWKLGGTLAEKTIEEILP